MNNKYRGYFEEDCRVNGFHTDGIINKVKIFLFPPKTYTFLRLLRKIESIRCRNDSNILMKLRLFFIYKRYQKIGLDLSFEISPFTCGGGLRLLHPGGIIINSRAQICDNFTIRSFSVIGNKKAGANDCVPKIGNNVEVGCNCSIIGNIRIGNNVSIGAGSVVVTDIPDNSICVGNPAKVIKTIDRK